MDVVTGVVLFAASKHIAPELAKCVGGFLSRCTNPIGDAIGQDLASGYKGFRALNFAKVLAAAQKNLEDCGKGDAPVQLPEEFTFRALDEASKSADDRIQKMWGGLIASVSKEASSDNSELLWVNLLSKMTPLQAALLEWSAQETKLVIENGTEETGCWVINSELTLPKFPSVPPLVIDAELHELKISGLVHPSPFSATESLAKGVCAAATIRGLQLYRRSQGYPGADLGTTAQPGKGQDHCFRPGGPKFTADHDARWL